MKNIHHPGTPCNIKVQSYYKGLSLIDGRWGFSSPNKLEIEITRKCNFNCIHCWNNSSEEKIELPFELIKKEIDSFQGLSIKFTGGEPFLYKSFIDLLRLCKEKNCNTEITSNGTLINKDISSILRDYIDKLNISLHGSTKEIHEEITRKTNSYVESINAIKRMQDGGLNPTINYTVMKKNMDDIKGMIIFARKLNVKSLRFNTLRNCGRGKILERISKEEINELRERILDNLVEGIELERSELYSEGYLRNLDCAQVYGCSGMRSQVYISSNGDVYPCSLSNDIVGNIKQNDLKQIWDGKKASEFRKRFICYRNNCNLKERCGGKCKA